MFHQTLPAAKYEQFVKVLLAHTQATADRVTLTDTVAPPGQDDIQQYLVIIAPDFAALLTATATSLPGFLTVELTFTPETVIDFLQQLPASQHRSQNPTFAVNASILSPLIPAILTDLLSLCAAELSPQTSRCQPQVNLAVQQRMHRERLIHEITTQIRQSLELPDILRTAVEQIRDFLQADRVLIIEEIPEGTRKVTYEARSDRAWSSLIGVVAPTGLPGNQSPCKDGQILVISDLEAQPIDSGAWQELRVSFQVKSLLIVPILVQGKVWGFLMAHDCQQPRLWYSQEQEFLNHVCNHISIAIHQSQIYQQLQQQKATLEDRVAERTQALRQSLLSAESAHRVKSDFLATISHELRSPLTCVIGMSATLLRWPLGPLTEKQRQYLETIHDSGTHLLELINRILELSQVEVGQTALRIQSFSLSQLARQVLQRVRAMAMTAQLNLKLELEIPANFDTFTADPHRLQQVLIHLLTNAIKFTPTQGNVMLRVECDAQEARFTVSDTGIGIPSHLQPLLFQLFQQLDTPYQRRYEGIGLGLAFTQQIVELHHGTITVQSQEEHGSTFAVAIPRQSQESSFSPLPSQTPEGRIILIEEQEDTATLICELLTATGYQVIWMTDLVIEQLPHFQPLLVIVSQRLDQFNLNRLVQHLQDTPATQQTKVILLCAPDSAINLSEARPGTDTELPYLQRVDAYLHYPLDPEELLAQVSALTQLETTSLFIPMSVS